MISTLAIQAAEYMVWWAERYGTQQQQIDARQRLRELQTETR